VKRVLIFDLDGTIFVNSKISKELRDVIDELSKSKIVIFASGRMLSSMEILLDNYDLSGIKIAYNGALVRYDELYKFCLDYENSINVIDFLRMNDVHRQIYVDDVLYVEEDNEFAKAYSDQSGIGYNVISDLKEIAKKGCVYKILAFGFPEKIRSLKQKAKDISNNVDVFTSSELYLEFVKRGINKKFAVEFLSQKIGFSLDEAVAFGDGENDAELLKSVGISFAMRPGNEKSLVSAKYITDNEDGKGVLRAIDFLKTMGEI